MMTNVRWEYRMSNVKINDKYEKIYSRKSVYSVKKNKPTYTCTVCMCKYWCTDKICFIPPVQRGRKGEKYSAVRADKDEYLSLKPWLFSEVKCGNVLLRLRVTTASGEKEQPPLQMCVRLQEAAGERRRWEQRERSDSSLPAPPVHPIHHCASALFSCSSTSREGWEAPILSWQPSAVHSQSHIITTFIFISIDTRPFPPLKLNQRGCRKGGREERKRGSWWWNAGLGHSSLHSNLHANGLVWERGLYHEEWTGAEAGKQLWSTVQGHRPTDCHESPRCQQDSHTHTHT